MISETDVATQSLKEDKHKFHVSAHHDRKATELYKIEINNAKINVKTLQAQKTTLEHKVADFNSKFVNLKSTDQLQIDDLQEEIDFQRKRLVVKMQKFRN